MNRPRDYTITELEAQTGQGRRTIHFYIQQGVIPPPLGAGGGAKYSEEHLLRLQLIPILQRSHLKLSGVKRALDAMTIDQMRQLLSGTTKTLEVEKPAQLRSWLLAQVTAESAEPEIEPDAEQAKAKDLSSFSFAQLSQSPRKQRLELGKSPGPKPDAQVSVPSNTWQRIALANGVELHIQSDLLASYQNLIEETVRLFNTEPK